MPGRTSDLCLGVTGVVLVLIFSTACSRPRPLPVFGTVPGFQLTDSSGEPFSSASLRGHIWVADFIFTNCPGACPRMSAKMQALQNSTPPDVQLLSLSVDPDRDTPDVLRNYAQRFHADSSRWHLLTGDLTEINRLSFEVFQLANLTTPSDHSTRFVLVDARGRIRGLYATLSGIGASGMAASGITVGDTPGSEDAVARLRADIATLRQEK